MRFVPSSHFVVEVPFLPNHLEPWDWHLSCVFRISCTDICLPPHTSPFDASLLLLSCPRRSTFLWAWVFWFFTGLAVPPPGNETLAAHGKAAWTSSRCWAGPVEQHYALRRQRSARATQEGEEQDLYGAQRGTERSSPADAAWTS